MDVTLTPNEIEQGWTVEVCMGNSHKTGCGGQYKKLNWHTPSRCPYCNATFVD